MTISKINYRKQEIDYKPLSKAQKLMMQRDFDNVFDVCLFGASGVGKTVAGIISSMGPQKDGSFLVDRPEYRALYLRRESTLLQRSGLLDAAHMWYSRFYPKVEYNKVEKTFTFPSGAKIFFSGVEQESDKEKFKGYTELHAVIFEELTQFSKTIYEFIVSRLRTKLSIPLRIRSTTNSGDKYEEWVMDRYKPWITRSAVPLEKDIEAEWGEVLYFEGTVDGRLVTKSPGPHSFSFCGIETFINDIKPDNDKFMSAQIEDPVLRAQLVDGVWGLKPTAGLYFKEEDFFLARLKVEPSVRIRYWDKACSGKRGDYLCGMLISHYMNNTTAFDVNESYFLVEDLYLGKVEPAQVKSIIENIASKDGKHVFIGFEQEPGSSGKELMDIYKRDLERQGYRVIVDQKKESKINRASAISPLAKKNRIGYIANQYTQEMFNQLINFPAGKNDDVVDCLSSGIHLLRDRLPRPQKVDKKSAQQLIPLFEKLESMRQF